MQPGVTKHHLLLVDGDPKSLRVLDVSLKKAGFQVTTATNGREAIAALESESPDLVISDTHMPEVDGFELCRRIKQKPEWASIPFLFLASRTSIEDKIRGLELGVEDYLTKPIYIKEITIRVRMALQRAQRERLESRRDGRTKFAGQLTDIGMVDLVQTIELNRKSGIIYIVNKDRRRGAVYFRDGKIIDAEAGRLSGAEALYRLFSWSEGSFEVEFKSIRRKDVIELSPQALLMEGMRRLDEWTRLLETMPPLDTVFEVDYHLLAERLSDLPDEVNGILRLFDGRRSLLQVIDDCDFPDLEALTVIGKLYGDKLIYETRREVQPDRPATSRLERWLSASESLSDHGGEEPVGDERNRRITARYQAVPDDDEALDAGVDAATEAAPSADASNESNVAGADEPAAAATSEETPPASPERLSDRSRPVTLVGWPLNEGEEATPSTVQVMGSAASREEPSLPVATGAPPDVPDAVAGNEAPELAAAGSSSELPGGSSVDLLAGDSSPELLSGGLTPELAAEGAAPPSTPDADLAALLNVVNEALPNEPEPAVATVQTDAEQATAAEPPAAPNVHEEVTVTRAPVPPSAPSVTGDDADELDLRPRRGRKMLVVAGLAAAAAAGLFAWKVKGVRTAPSPVAAAVEPPVPAAQAQPAQVPPAAPEPAVPAVEMPGASPAAPEIAPANASETAAKVAQESAPETSPPVNAPAGAPPSPAAPEAAEACRRAYADGNGRYKDVLGACRPAAESQPGNAEFLVMLAHAELERGNTRAALSWAKKAVGADPERAEAHVFIGQAEQEAGNVAAAKAAYRRYLKLSPKGRYARDLRAILDTL